jgi:hypothetical protein
MEVETDSIVLLPSEAELYPDIDDPGNRTIHICSRGPELYEKHGQMRGGLTELMSKDVMLLLSPLACQKHSWAVEAVGKGHEMESCWMYLNHIFCTPEFLKPPQSPPAVEQEQMQYPSLLGVES